MTDTRKEDGDGCSKPIQESASDSARPGNIARQRNAGMLVEPGAEPGWIRLKKGAAYRLTFLRPRVEHEGSLRWVVREEV